MVQNHLKPKVPPLDFFGIVTPYFLNSAEQLFHSQYFIILCLSFFPNFSFGQRVPSRFHRWFRLEKRKFCELKVPFSKRLFRKKYFRKFLHVYSLGKCGFRVLCVSFGVILGTEKLKKLLKTVSFSSSRNLSQYRLVNPVEVTISCRKIGKLVERVSLFLISQLFGL